MTYISVPYTAWESVGGSPLRTTAITKTPYPEGEGVGGGASLVQSISITDTEHSIIEKRASDVCLHALEKLEALPYNNENKRYEKVCQDFYEYLDLCEQKNFIIKGYEVTKGKFKKVSLDYDNRWGPNRRKELSYKLDRLESWFSLQIDRPVTMITFTSFHEGLPIKDAWFDLNKSRTKILKLIRKYFGDVDYFWVTEPHKSGYAHYHLAVFADISNEKKDNKGKGIEDKFRDLWSKKYKTGNHTYGLDFSKKQGDDKLKSLKAYLSKYLRKGFLMDEWSIGVLLFNAHLWDTGFRMYGGSKRVSSIMKLPEDKDPDIVWLETRYQDLEKTPEGEFIETERITWYRQYIPDWIDSPLWAEYIEYSWVVGNVYERWEHYGQPDDTVKIYDWGRRYAGGAGGSHGCDPTHGVIKNVG